MKDKNTTKYKQHSLPASHSWRPPPNKSTVQKTLTDSVGKASLNKNYFQIASVQFSQKHRVDLILPHMKY